MNTNKLTVNGKVINNPTAKDVKKALDEMKKKGGGVFHWEGSGRSIQFEPLNKKVNEHN